jgi:hypothetical protein
MSEFDLPDFAPIADPAHSLGSILDFEWDYLLPG